MLLLHQLPSSSSSHSPNLTHLTSPHLTSTLLARLASPNCLNCYSTWLLSVRASEQSFQLLCRRVRTSGRGYEITKSPTVNSSQSTLSHPLSTSARPALPCLATAASSRLAWLPSLPLSCFPWIPLPRRVHARPSQIPGATPRSLDGRTLETASNKPCFALRQPHCRSQTANNFALKHHGQRRWAEARVRCHVDCQHVQLSSLRRPRCYCSPGR